MCHNILQTAGQSKMVGDVGVPDSRNTYEVST